MTPTQKQILNKAKELEAGKEIALAKEFVAIEEHIENINIKVDNIATELKKKSEEDDLLYEVDEEKIIESVLSKVQIPTPEKGDKGDNYVLTDEDKKEIANTIPVPIVVEKEIRYETVTEKPIEITKEVAVADTPTVIVDKINSLPTDEGDKFKIHFSHIYGYPELDRSKVSNVTQTNGGWGAIKEIIAGTGVTIDNSNLGYPVVNATPAVAPSLHDVSGASGTTLASLYTMTDNVDVEFEDAQGATVMYLKESTNNTGFGTNAPDARVHAYKAYTLPEPVNLGFSESAPVSASNYTTGDFISYLIYAYTDNGTTRVFSAPLAGEHTVVNTAFGVDMGWDDVVGAAGYLIVSTFADRFGGVEGYVYVTDNFFTDTNNGASQSPQWTQGNPDVSNQSGTYQTRSVYNDSITTWGLHTNVGVLIGGKSFGSFIGGVVGGSLFIRPDLDLFDQDINIFKVGKDDAVSFNGKPFGLDWSNADTGSSRFKLWNETAYADLGIKDLYASVVNATTLNGATVNVSGLTASRAVVTDGSKNLASSAVTTTELGYVSGVTSSIQTQIDAIIAGGGTPAGLDTQVQFNDSSSFGGDAGFTYNKTTDFATLAGGLVAPTIVGGTGTTSDLNLKTTSGVGASGADMHFLVGNNGGTEAMTILNDGTIGVNNTAPSGSRMVINSTTSATRGLMVIRAGSSSVNPSALGVVNSAITAEAGALIENGGPNDYGVLRMHGTRVATNDFLGAFEFGDKTSVADPRVGIILGYAGTASGRGYFTFLTRDAGGFDTNARFLEGGNVDFGFKVFIGGTTTPTAKLHLAAGSTSATTAPLKFTTGTSMTAAEAGAMEYTTDDLFFTISTGTARKRILFADPVGGLTSGRLALITTNGRLTDLSTITHTAGVITATGFIGTLDGALGATTPSSAIVTSLQADSITNDTGLAAGVYTPTRSAEANMDANVTMFEAQYIRVGNTVTVSGRFTADPTLTATATSFEMTLPVASNIGAVEDLAGTAFCGTIAGMGAQISGSVANNTMVVTWISTDVTAQSWSFTATYQVI